MQAVFAELLSITAFRRTLNEPVLVVFPFLETWILPDSNIYHNLNGPAITHYLEDGNIHIEEYRIYGEIPKRDKPYLIEYLQNGDVAHRFCRMYRQNSSKRHKTETSVFRI